MKEKILQLFTEGDALLKESKSELLASLDDQCVGTNKCLKAIKKYIETYQLFLNSTCVLTNNFHLLLHEITEKDLEFEMFASKIFQVKCFSEESKKYKEEFFLYDNEVNDVINIALEIRDYISKKIHFDQKFLYQYQGTSFMAI